ncbi:uncharacterized protein LOC135836415 [Planococcus citri]|uniref:uncharacterized protein LOC135836415 n=1 Tax=Planococcus citri TaxID=170843 RepID=UPI0031F8963D
MAEKFCGLFSHRTGTIIILSFPVMLIIQGSILALFMSSSSSSSSSASSGPAPSASDVLNTIVFGLILASCCFIGLLGVERKNPSFLLPAFGMMVILIISAVTCLLTYILNYFQLATHRDTLKSNDQFFYFVIFAAMLMYACNTVFEHLKELKSLVDQKSRDQYQTIV